MIKEAPLFAHFLEYKGGWRSRVAQERHQRLHLKCETERFCDTTTIFRICFHTVRDMTPLHEIRSAVNSPRSICEEYLPLLVAHQTKKIAWLLIIIVIILSEIVMRRVSSNL